MNKLRATKKITMASFKAFANRNANNLYVKGLSDFNGMSDMVEHNENPKWMKTEISSDDHYYSTGIKGVYTVGGSRDWFDEYEDDKYYGIKVYNCCGSAVLAIEK